MVLADKWSSGCRTYFFQSAISDGKHQERSKKLLVELVCLPSRPKVPKANLSLEILKPPPEFWKLSSVNPALISHVWCGMWLVCLFSLQDMVWCLFSLQDLFTTQLASQNVSLPAMENKGGSASHKGVKPLSLFHICQWSIKTQGLDLRICCLDQEQATGKMVIQCQYTCFIL